MFLSFPDTFYVLWPIPACKYTYLLLQFNLWSDNSATFFHSSRDSTVLRAGWVQCCCGRVLSFIPWSLYPLGKVPSYSGGGISVAPILGLGILTKRTLFLYRESNPGCTCRTLHATPTESVQWWRKVLPWVSLWRTHCAIHLVVVKNNPRGLRGGAHQTKRVYLYLSKPCATLSVTFELTSLAILATFAVSSHNCLCVAINSSKDFTFKKGWQISLPASSHALLKSNNVTNPLKCETVKTFAIESNESEFDLWRN
jgi:hypothetical protein